MFRHCIAAVVIMGSLAATASGQEVKFEKYELSNGMTVILHEDHSLPIACTNLYFRVGSKDEPAGRSGFAHLFEHLMFMGTRRVPEGMMDQLLEADGAYSNASTEQDLTNYFLLGPSHLLPTFLWLEADRLEALGEQMTQEKLDAQREVVRNERRQGNEMQPYGKAELKVSELMYPPGHPYHNNVIGSHEDLQAATVRDVKEFFNRFYVPNNAALVVAGDFSAKEVRPLIDELFGTLPRGPQPPQIRAEPVSLPEVRRVAYLDKVQFARTSILYHSPAYFQAGDAEMDLAAAILGSGKNSRLYKRLIYEGKLAVDVSAEQQSSMLGSLFRIEVTARDGVSLDQIETAIDEVVGEFLAKGPTVEEVERERAGIEYGAIARLQSILAKANKLNEYEFHLGDPNSFKWDLERYSKATTENVRWWASKALTPNARLIMRVLPEPQDGTALPRDKQPGPATVRQFAPDMPQTFTLSNGVKVLHWRRSELPLVRVSLLLRGGAWRDEPDQAGKTYLAVSMLDEGAGELGALEFTDALDLLGARFGAACDHESVWASLSVLKQNLDKAMGLYADAILRPRFDPKEWDRVKTLHVQDLKRSEDQPGWVAGRVGMRTLFGDAHPYGRAVDGTVKTVEGLSLEALKQCYAEQSAPTNATFFVAGDLTAEEAKAAIEKAFGAWQAPAGAATTQPTASQPAATQPTATEPIHIPHGNTALRVVLVDRPGSVQTVIRFYMPGPRYANPNRVKLELLNTILGGTFTSRLNMNLREKHGWTYGAGSSFAMEPSTGYFVASSDVQADVTGAALREFLLEFGSLRTGNVTAEEVQKARETQRMSMIDSFQGLTGLLSTAQVLEQNGLPFSAIADDLAAISAVTADELNGLAKEAIPLKRAVLVLVGDEKVIREQIANLELPMPTKMNVAGDVIEPPATAPTAPGQ